MASSPEIDQWNEGWRSSPMYADVLRQVGVVDPSRPFKLNDKQRKQLQGLLEAQAGQGFPKGVEIDAAGNMNENEGFGKQAKKWGPIVGGIALTLFGIPGVFPGLLTAGGAAGAAGAAGAGASTGAGAAAGGGWAAVGKTALGLLPLAGRALSKGAEASAQNRGAELDATMEAEKLNQQAYRDWFNQMQQRVEQGRLTRNDAWKAMQQGAYTRDWKPSEAKFSPYTRALVAPSDDVREAGGARAEDARTRLTGYELPEPERQKYNINPRLLRGSGWEKAAGVAGAVLTGVGAARTLLRPPAAGSTPVSGQQQLTNTGVVRPSVMPRSSFINPDDPLLLGGFERPKYGDWRDYAQF